jgi:hypothetical protein
MEGEQCGGRNVKKKDERNSATATALSVFPSFSLRLSSYFLYCILPALAPPTKRPASDAAARDLMAVKAPSDHNQIHPRIFLG